MHHDEYDSHVMLSQTPAAPPRMLDPLACSNAIEAHRVRRRRRGGWIATTILSVALAGAVAMTLYAIGAR